MARTATWGVPLSGRHTFPPCGVRLCCTVQRVVQACTATTLEVDYAELLMSCWHTQQLYGVARYATVYFGTVWHVMPRCTLTWYCVARYATVYFNLVLCGTLCHGVLWHALPLCCVWHALPTSRVTHAVRGGLRQVLLLSFCVCNTLLFYYLLHSLSGM